MATRNHSLLRLQALAGIALIVGTGCANPQAHRDKADRAAQNIIAASYPVAMEREGSVDIERPSQTLRRRLLLEQDLPVSGPASLGRDALAPIEHWPDTAAAADAQRDAAPPALDRPLSLMQTLQIGARNSAEYQARKEDVFRRALDLDLEQQAFRSVFLGQLRSRGRYEGEGDQGGVATSASGGMERQLAGGSEIATELAVDLANLLTGGGASALGLAVDTSISIPLLRGAGRHIATEPLTQAERNVVYAIWDFERFKQQFAVNVASRYFTVLRRQDEVRNSRENYRSALASAERSRRLADAGRIQEIEVDQAAQNELRARQRWLAADQSARQALDAFKMLIGLPPDAAMALAPDDRIQAAGSAMDPSPDPAGRDREEPTDAAANRETAWTLDTLDDDETEPWAQQEAQAIRTALAQRLDLKKSNGQVYDAQRSVVVAADRLRMEATLLGSATFGSRRASVESATQDSARLQLDRGVFSSLLTLNFPLERTAERAAFRKSLIDLERSVRSLQELEDNVKLSVRNGLRDMRLAHENVRIQADAVAVAEKRVRSVTLFLEAGRAQMRDLIEAQDALLAARNGLTAAQVDYRIAEMEIQRDMGALHIDEEGRPDLYFLREEPHDEDRS